jgi:hypothetical protein
MGCRTATTFNPLAINNSIILLEVWLFPQPVLTAPTAINGLVLFTMVSLGPNRIKLAPAAFTLALIAITLW